MKVSLGRSLPIALVVAAGALVVVLVWRSHAPAVQARAGDPATPTAQAQSAAPGASSAPPAAGHPTAEPTLAEVAAAPVDEYAESPIGDVMHRVLDNDRQLATFKSFYNRPLLDEASKAQYHALLSDPATLASVEHDLLYPEETKADQAGSIKRLMKIDYLREALEWKENPQRDMVIALISQMILTDNYPSGMTMDMRLSLSGDKMELYELLVEYAPAQASATLQASKGTRLAAMVAYIANSIEVRKQLEAKLENQVTP